MTNKFNKLTRLLTRELGLAPNGRPRFCWMHSEDPELLRKVPVGHDYQCRCGLNKTIHSPRCTGLIVPIVKTELRQWPGLGNQWVMALWKSPTALRDAERGYYVPVSYWGKPGDGAPRSYISLDPGIEPNEDLTQAFIYAMKRELEKKFREVVDEGDAIVAAKSKVKRDARRGKIGELMPLYNSLPGKRSGSASLPDPTLQARGNSAPALIEKA